MKKLRKLRTTSIDNEQNQHELRKLEEQHIRNASASTNRVATAHFEDKLIKSIKQEEEKYEARHKN